MVFLRCSRTIFEVEISKILRFHIENLLLSGVFRLSNFTRSLISFLISQALGT